MYAQFQTSLYIPPPVVSGIVPKNGFGNLDVFVPSMVPPGGVHLPSMSSSHHLSILFKFSIDNRLDKLMVKAAKLLGIDFAEAVVS